VYHGEIERTEVFIEWEICQIVINIEEKGIFEILWWLDIRYPVEFVCYDLTRLANNLLLV